MEIEKSQNYYTPQCEVIEVKTQTVLCQSGGNESMPEYDWGNGGFKQS